MQFLLGFSSLSNSGSTISAGEKEIELMLQEDFFAQLIYLFLVVFLEPALTQWALLMLMLTAK